jgi:hypothetical protein
MRKHTNYMILPEVRLILECCKGQASVEEAIAMKNEEIMDSRYNPVYNIIVDFRDFEASMDSKTSEAIMNFFGFLRDLNLKNNVAFLTSEPHQVVISRILKDLSNDISAFRIEIFSTVEAAIRYLGYPAGSFALLDNRIKELNDDTE